MGHYDNCREGYCGKCGAGPGNFKNGKCEFCHPSKPRILPNVPRPNFQPTLPKPIMSKAKPITPKEARAAKLDSIPAQVIEAVNELLISNCREGSTTIILKQNEVVGAIQKKFLNHVSREQVFEAGWLDFEEYYKRAGWSVEYDKPGYNEDYEAFFKFTEKR